MTAIVLILLGALTAWLALHRLHETRDVHRIQAPWTNPNLALAVYVGQHTLARAQERFGPHVTAHDVASDIIDAVRNGRHSLDIHRRRTGSVRRSKPGHEWAWNETCDRVYVIAIDGKHLTAVTAIPAGTSTPPLAPPIVDAIRVALARYAT